MNGPAQTWEIPTGTVECSWAEPLLYYPTTKEDNVLNTFKYLFSFYFCSWHSSTRILLRRVLPLGWKHRRRTTLAATTITAATVHKVDEITTYALLCVNSDCYPMGWITTNIIIPSIYSRWMESVTTKGNERTCLLYPLGKRQREREKHWCRFETFTRPPEWVL